MEAKQQTPSERRQRYLKRWQVLKSARSSYDAHWRALDENFSPRTTRFLADDVNKGGNYNQHIINGLVVRALRTLVAGVQSMVFPSSREWFDLSVTEPSLMEFESVSAYLGELKDAINAVLLRSNFYREAPSIIEDLALLGPHCSIIDEDDADDARFYPLPVGTYCVALDARGEASALYYETSLTVEQLVEKFGLEACSQRVRDAYEAGRYDDVVKVMRVIEPNRKKQEYGVGPAGMAWSDCWFETECPLDTGFLGEAGYHSRPFIFGVWKRKSGDVYGRSPTMDALGDAEALQAEEYRSAAMGDLIAKQPMQGPPDVDSKLVSMLPGGYTAVPSMAAGSKVGPVMDVASLRAAKQDSQVERQQLAQRIDALLYVDTLMLLQQSDGAKTATEVNELREEKILQLAPLSDNLKDGIQDPMIARLIDILGRRGKLPKVPQELVGRTLNVRYLSPMAAAQRMQASMGLQRLATFVLQSSQAAPQLLDKVNWDELVNVLGRALDTPPKVVRSDEDTQKLRAAKARAQQQVAQAEAAQQAAQTAQTLSKTPVGGAADGGQSALDALLRTRGAA